jgi:Ca2+-binding EF-hand superfamily protein
MSPTTPPPSGFRIGGDDKAHSSPHGSSFESIKMAAFNAIATASDAAGLADALAKIMKDLPAPPTAAVNNVSSAPAGSNTVVAPAAASPAASAPGSFEATVQEHLKAMKKSLGLRGTHGILALGKKFRSMDDSGDSLICFDEFKKACNEMKLGLTEKQLTALFRYFDNDCSGKLSYDEFIGTLRGELNERRKKMVEMAYKVLDKTGDGQVTVHDLEGRYDASKHPDVIAGVKTQRQILNEMMELYEAQGGGVKGDGIVSLDEFSKYYGFVSASVDDDDYFELMIRNAWHISGGEGWCANTTCKRVLVNHADGTQTVQELTDDFDLDTKDLDAIRRKLESQGIKDAKNIAVYGLMVDEPSGPQASSPRPGTASTPGRRNNQLNSSIVF